MQTAAIEKQKEEMKLLKEKEAELKVRMAGFCRCSGMLIVLFNV